MHSELLRFQHTHTGRVTCTYISSKQTFTGMCTHTHRHNKKTAAKLRTICLLKKVTFPPTYRETSNFEGPHPPKKKTKNRLKVSTFKLFFGCFGYFFSQGKTASGTNRASSTTRSTPLLQMHLGFGTHKEVIKNRDPSHGFLVGGLRR